MTPTEALKYLKHHKIEGRLSRSGHLEVPEKKKDKSGLTIGLVYKTIKCEICALVAYVYKDRTV